MYLAGGTVSFARCFIEKVDCDAILIQMSRELDSIAPVSIHLVWRTSDADHPRDAYYTIKDAPNSTTLENPRPIPENGIFTLRQLPAEGITIRIDFPHRVHVSKVALIRPKQCREQDIAIRSHTLLSRDGGIIQTEVPACATVVTTIPRTVAQVDAAFASMARNERVEFGFCLLERLARLDRHRGLAMRTLAHLCLDTIAKNAHWLETSSLSPFSWLLNHSKAIVELMAEINHLSAETSRQKGGRPSPQFVISKHSINPSWLMSRPKGFLAAMREVMEFGERSGIPVMTAYGTLLGAVRDQRFIPHDDDVDLIVDLGATSKVDMIDKLGVLAGQLERAGIKVRQAAGPSIAHLTVDTKSGGVDIFSFWTEGDRLHLLMENYKFRSIDAAIILGGAPSTVTLYGESFPAPHDHVAFLAERYGADWRIPRQFHEWPWSLDDV